MNDLVKTRADEIERWQDHGENAKTPSHLRIESIENDINNCEVLLKKISINKEGRIEVTEGEKITTEEISSVETLIVFFYKDYKLNQMTYEDAYDDPEDSEQDDKSGNSEPLVRLDGSLEFREDDDGSIESVEDEGEDTDKKGSYDVEDDSVFAKMFGDSLVDDEQNIGRSVHFLTIRIS